MGKLTKSRVLQDGEGVLRGPKMRGWGKKIFSVMWGGNEVRQNHTGRGRIPHHLDPPHPIAISTLAHSMIVYSLSLSWICCWDALIRIRVSVRYGYENRDTTFF